MDTAIFIYIIACYSCGAIGLTLSTVMVLARPDPIERAHFRFLVAFGLIIASMTVASYMISREKLDEAGLNIASFVNITGCTLIPMTLPRFMEFFLPWSWKRIVTRVFLVLGALVWIAFFLLRSTPYGGVAFGSVIVVLSASILYVTICGSLAKESPLDEAGRRRWDGMMKQIKWVAIVLVPLFIVVDFFPSLIPGLREALPPILKASPLFYALWNVSFAINAIPALQHREPEPRAPAPSACLDIEGFELSPRECEVALRLARGASYKEIAFELGISIATVKTHVARVYQKTGTGTKMDLLRILSRPASEPGPGH
jgi:DNA-binding CsgD family transcriptional regulator